MKVLITTISLLLTTQIYCFDTLSVKPSLQGIKSDDRGTTVYQYLDLPIELGAYVLQIEGIPKRLKDQDFNFESKGVEIIKISLNRESPTEKKLTNQEAYEQMQVLKDRLKEIDHEESEELKFKKEVLLRMVNQHDINSIKELYKEKDIIFRKERMSIYQKLKKLQSEVFILNSLRNDHQNDTHGTLFLSIVKHHLDAKILLFNYFLAHPKEGMESVKSELQKDSQLVRGRVIESQSRIPLIYALVEVYDDKELIKTIYTDEMGIFETELAINKNYTIVIFQEGYKDRKVKSFQAMASHTPIYRTYTLKEKTSINITEVASYVLQIASLVAVNW